MRGFVVTWLLGFVLVGLAAFGVAGALPAGAPAQPAARGERLASAESPPESSAPFTQDEAIEVVGARFGRTFRGDEFRRELKRAARVTHHSAQHWTVRWGPASWTAHGPGRYAEPDNDAARKLEADVTAGV